MVRIGSRSKEPSLEQYHLHAVLKQRGSESRPRVGDLKAELEKLETEIKVILICLYCTRGSLTVPQVVERRVSQPDRLRLEDVRPFLEAEAPLFVEAFEKQEESGWESASNDDVFSSWAKASDLASFAPAVSSKKLPPHENKSKSQDNKFALLRKDKEELDAQAGGGEGAPAVVPAAVPASQRPLQDVLRVSDPYTLSKLERETVVKHLHQLIRETNEEHLVTLCSRHERARIALEERYSADKANHFRQVQLIGATTTGAAGIARA